jgi:hypothetical protein
MFLSLSLLYPCSLRHLPGSGKASQRLKRWVEGTRASSAPGNEFHSSRYMGIGHCSRDIVAAAMVTNTVWNDHQSVGHCAVEYATRLEIIYRYFGVHFIHFSLLYSLLTIKERLMRSSRCMSVYPFNHLSVYPTPSFGNVWDHLSVCVPKF